MSDRAALRRSSGGADAQASPHAVGGQARATAGGPLGSRRRIQPETILARLGQRGERATGTLPYALQTGEAVAGLGGQ